METKAGLGTQTATAKGTQKERKTKTQTGSKFATDVEAGSKMGLDMGEAWVV